VSVLDRMLSGPQSQSGYEQPVRCDEDVKNYTSIVKIKTTTLTKQSVTVVSEGYQ